MDFYNWAKSKNIPLNGPVLMEKAQKIAEEAGVGHFKATDGWFSRWKKRNGLVFATLQGEAVEADTSGMEAFLKNEWPELQCQFHWKNIFNTDETGIYFCALPDLTYVKEKSKRTTKGFKTAKDQITALVTCSLEGEKLPLLIIGQSKSPCCFKSVCQMPAVNYKSSQNAWMGPIWGGVPPRPRPGHGTTRSQNPDARQQLQRPCACSRAQECNHVISACEHDLHATTLQPRNYSIHESNLPNKSSLEDSGTD